MLNPSTYFLAGTAEEPYKPNVLVWHDKKETRPLFECTFLQKYFLAHGRSVVANRIIDVKASLAFIYDNIKTYHNVHTDWEVRSKRVKETLYEIYVTDDLGGAIESIYALSKDAAEFMEAVQSLIEPYILKQIKDCK